MMYDFAIFLKAEMHNLYAKTDDDSMLNVVESYSLPFNSPKSEIYRPGKEWSGGSIEKMWTILSSKFSEKKQKAFQIALHKIKEKYNG